MFHDVFFFEIPNFTSCFDYLQDLNYFFYVLTFTPKFDFFLPDFKFYTPNIDYILRHFKFYHKFRLFTSIFQIEVQSLLQDFAFYYFDILNFCFEIWNSSPQCHYFNVRTNLPVNYLALMEIFIRNLTSCPRIKFIQKGADGHSNVHR